MIDMFQNIGPGDDNYGRDKTIPQTEKIITVQQIRELKLSLANLYNIPIDYTELDRSCYDEYLRINGIKQETSEYIPIKGNEAMFFDRILDTK
jgi:hypothetical protein